MVITSTKSPCASLRLTCVVMIPSITAVLVLSALASPHPAQSIMPLLGIHNVSTTCVQIRAETKRRAAGGASEWQAAVSALPTAAQPLELKSGAELVCFALPGDPLYQGINQHSKPPPRCLEAAVAC